MAVEAATAQSRWLRKMCCFRAILNMSLEAFASLLRQQLHIKSISPSTSNDSSEAIAVLHDLASAYTSSRGVVGEFCISMLVYSTQSGQETTIEAVKRKAFRFYSQVLEFKERSVDIKLLYLFLNGFYESTAFEFYCSLRKKVLQLKFGDACNMHVSLDKLYLSTGEWVNVVNSLFLEHYSHTKGVQRLSDRMDNSYNLAYLSSSLLAKACIEEFLELKTPPKSPKRPTSPTKVPKFMKDSGHIQIPRRSPLKQRPFEKLPVTNTVNKAQQRALPVRCKVVVVSQLTVTGSSVLRNSSSEAIQKLNSQLIAETKTLTERLRQQETEYTIEHDILKRSQKLAEEKLSLHIGEAERNHSQLQMVTAENSVLKSCLEKLVLFLGNVDEQTSKAFGVGELLQEVSQRLQSNLEGVKLSYPKYEDYINSRQAFVSLVSAAHKPIDPKPSAKTQVKSTAIIDALKKKDADRQDITEKRKGDTSSLPDLTRTTKDPVSVPKAAAKVSIPELPQQESADKALTQTNQQKTPQLSRTAEGERKPVSTFSPPTAEPKNPIPVNISSDDEEQRTLRIIQEVTDSTGLMSHRSDFDRGPSTQTLDITQESTLKQEHDLQTTPGSASKSYETGSSLRSAFILRKDNETRTPKKVVFPEVLEATEPAQSKPFESTSPAQPKTAERLAEVPKPIERISPAPQSDQTSTEESKRTQLTEGQEIYEVQIDYDSKNDKMLKLTKGDRLVKESTRREWFYGTNLNTGKKGFFLPSFVLKVE